MTNNSSADVVAVVAEVEGLVVVVRPILPLEGVVAVFLGDVAIPTEVEAEADAAAAANAALLIERERSRTSFDRRSPLAVATVAAAAAGEEVA